ncbi:MAG: hypothetical protein A3D53_02830 [Candidatus Magasanikbacteria bacterium RIFCSPHIGHO2_02_FULL_45_10]|uniref:Uncharacterized protein n=1 Tax=Candidatus Magasanikbacteria bacterium RIFCSPHIGHO2_02_FULL_45_10 TaxID=1798679 RepID=A0A1F6M9T1_9BACT|nr:MAG: hypothetical protein A3D53_02830 [Candidatus Magasanikbacteria bacterium RIFCSPHIGHO2_02_FULL_45_10]
MSTLTSTIKRTLQNFLGHPATFLVRLVYRIVIVVPFQLVVSGLHLFSRQKLKDREPLSFCFIITSLIYTKGGQIQYESPRTVFSPETRAEQTLETIASIRDKVPGAKIILVEAGLREDLPLGLDKKIDQYIYLGNRKLIRAACDSHYKSLGEIVMLVAALKRSTIVTDFYFKISGRYHLNDQFKIANWKGRGLFVLKYIQPDYICTRLYGLRSEALATWKSALWKSVPLALISYAVENTLSKYIPRHQVHALEVLGVSGIGASSQVEDID